MAAIPAFTVVDASEEENHASEQVSTEIPPNTTPAPSPAPSMEQDPHLNTHNETVNTQPNNNVNINTVAHPPAENIPPMNAADQFNMVHLPPFLLFPLLFLFSSISSFPSASLLFPLLLFSLPIASTSP